MVLIIRERSNHFFYNLKLCPHIVDAIDRGRSTRWYYFQTTTGFKPQFFQNWKIVFTFHACFTVSERRRIRRWNGTTLVWVDGYLLLFMVFKIRNWKGHWNIYVGHTRVTRFLIITVFNCKRSRCMLILY
jgi:hypothetical protein